MGLPGVASTAGRLPPAGAGPCSAFAGAGPPVSMAGVPAREGPVAGSIGPTKGGGSGGAGRLMYRLYGTYLAVLSARMGAEVAARGDAGAGPSVFAIARRCPPDARPGYPWGQQGAGPHLPAPPTAPLACAPALRRGGRGTRPSRWRSCSGLAGCGDYQDRAT